MMLCITNFKNSIINTLKSATLKRKLKKIPLVVRGHYQDTTLTKILFLITQLILPELETDLSIEIVIRLI